ncbi:hypothetical protein HPB49_005794 [Dermacentor silvarum]|uniref:Uncharacterized protein n=1 Tax=Dermacentor silvarum TaxID=543639 RepID=A0ACB8DVW1_DERSI|nr:hypothetical protein HPB49_005794 [Dermacentor silvarum]
MVKDVTCLDTQYWVLLELPRQEKQEQVNAYVLRACATLEKASESRTQDAAARATADEEARERKQRLDGLRGTSGGKESLARQRSPEGRHPRFVTSQEGSRRMCVGLHCDAAAHAPRGLGELTPLKHLENVRSPIRRQRSDETDECAAGVRPLPGELERRKNA